MNRGSIEQALTGLIPTLNGPLPAELVELAVSLLARSRSVAHSLKPDEEIARPYACAQLACERLKKRLNLPSITPRPPCPPRIYKKLYKYLESALPSATIRDPQTPQKPSTQAALSTRTTPKTPLSNRKTPRSIARDVRSVQEPPEWTMPLVRILVKEFSYPMAAPHIYTGVESTFPLLLRISAASAPETPGKRPRRAAAAPQLSSSKLPDTSILGLIAVVLFYVLSRMMDQEITPDQFLKWRDKAVSTLLASEAGKDAIEDDIVAEIEQLMPMAQEEGWLSLEWFVNIVPVEDGDEMEGIELTSQRDIPSKRTLKDSFGSENIGLGTMIQDATDYLGERQQEDYKRWKAGIMARIDEIETSRT